MYCMFCLFFPFSFPFLLHFCFIIFRFCSVSSFWPIICMYCMFLHMYGEILNRNFLRAFICAKNKSLEGLEYFYERQWPSPSSLLSPLSFLPPSTTLVQRVLWQNSLFQFNVHVHSNRIFFAVIELWTMTILSHICRHVQRRKHRGRSNFLYGAPRW